MTYLEHAQKRHGTTPTDTITYNGRDYHIYGTPTYTRYISATYHDPAEGGWDLGDVFVVDAETGEDTDYIEAIGELIEEKAEWDRCNRAFKHRIF